MSDDKINKQELQDKIISIICEYIIKENKELKQTLKSLVKEKRKYK